MRQFFSHHLTKQATVFQFAAEFELLHEKVHRLLVE